MLQPLTNLMKKALLILGSIKFLFQAKEALPNSIMLQNPSPSAQVRLNANASRTHNGAMLMQQKSQPSAPITFYSEGLNSAQGKYSMYDRELLESALLSC